MQRMTNKVRGKGEGPMLARTSAGGTGWPAAPVGTLWSSLPPLGCGMSPPTRAVTPPSAAFRKGPGGGVVIVVQDSVLQCFESSLVLNAIAILWCEHFALVQKDG